MHKARTRARVHHLVLRATRHQKRKEIEEQPRPLTYCLPSGDTGSSWELHLGASMTCARLTGRQICTVRGSRRQLVRRSVLRKCCRGRLRCAPRSSAEMTGDDYRILRFRTCILLVKIFVETVSDISRHHCTLSCERRWRVGPREIRVWKFIPIS